MGAATAIAPKGEEHLPSQYNLSAFHAVPRPTVALIKLKHIFRKQNDHTVFRMQPNCCKP